MTSPAHAGPIAELAEFIGAGQFAGASLRAGPVLVIATNCNGGIKEVICLREPPDRSALWHARCPDNPDFDGPAVAPLAVATTQHWFDPCELLRSDARSEYRAEYRERRWRVGIAEGMSRDGDDGETACARLTIGREFASVGKPVWRARVTSPHQETTG